ncbi:Uncharacterised protein [Bordetella pertussis]|nr:Uncharacterised protein [Bordetella pertussis]
MNEVLTTPDARPASLGSTSLMAASSPSAATSRPHTSGARMSKRITSLADSPSENAAMMILAGRKPSPTCMAV